MPVAANFILFVFSLFVHKNMFYVMFEINYVLHLNHSSFLEAC